MKITVKIPQHQHRYHKVLFDRELPFRCKKEESAKAFKRQPKHKGRDYE